VGGFAIVKDGEEAYEVQSCQLINLPQINSRSPLKKFLKNHFVVANSSSENTTFYRFHPKGRGGGVVISMPIQTGGISFPFSFQPYLIKYGPGPTIRHLEKNDAATVPSQIQSGGIGEANFVLESSPGLLDMNRSHSEILSSCPGWTEENTWAGPPLPMGFQPSMFYPRVRIYVWKKDYYQAEIQSVSGLIEDAPNQEKKLVDECDRLKQALTVRETLLSAIQEEENQLAQVKTEQEAILEKIIFLEQQLAINREALAGIEQQHQTDYGKIEALAQLIELVDLLRINVLQNSDGALCQFRESTMVAHRAAALNVPLSEEILGNAVRELRTLSGESDRAAGKSVIAVIGPSGAGKSTIVNHLLNVKLVKDPATDLIKVAEGQEEIAEIGQVIVQSKTYKTMIYERIGIPLTFADCGGTLDPGGPERELTIVTSLRTTLEQAENAIVLLCFDTHLLEPMRGQCFSEALGSVLKGFFVNYIDFARSFAIVFNRIITDPDGIPCTVEDIVNILRDFESEARAAGLPMADLYAFALREGGRYIHLYDPLADSSRERMVHALNHEMIPVAAEPERFSTPYSDNLREVLLGEMKQTAGLANQIYTEKAELTHCYEALQRDLALRRIELGQVDQHIAKLAERVRINHDDLEKIPPPEFFAEKINQINTDLLNIKNQTFVWTQRLHQIDTTDFITYHSGGNGWRVADGAVTLEPNKVF